ncbi:hypothetical protein B0T10DRAFT_520753 [Thelonectria olida]|uniref:Zn(2)-C6 fungal-type domain-containing protein n=1 Tax=Thelonectria olida TaxID=1576542 RepID=A0A9P8VWK7_9HYPO|nr:hypothetical protein B0T10DRAFT_520753 [Thelonectria olida]
MYGPAPPRRQKTHITRSRTGCRSCRERRKKCDEKKPACTSCVRLGRRCEPLTNKLAFRAVEFVSTGSGSRPGSQPHDPCSGTSNHSASSPSQNYTIPEKEAPASSVSIPGDTYLPMKTMRESGQRSFYLHVWEATCSPALHSAFCQLGKSQHLPSVLTDAIMSLSACHISRMLPQRKSFDPSGTPGLSFRPHLGHQTVSQELYGSAMLSLAKWCEFDDDASFNIVLAAMTLFGYIESSMSNFQQFGSHSSGVERLLMSATSHMARPNRLAAELLAGWMQAKAHNWWLRFHFSTPSFHRSSHSLVYQLWLLPLLGMVDSPQALVLSSLCECYRLNSQTFITQWEESNKISASSGGGVRFQLADDGESHGLPDVNGLSPAAQLLDVQRKSLNDWHAHLPLSNLPIEAFSEAPSHHLPLDNTFKVQPLRFNSHNAAMNYAYYVVARIMLCTDFLESSQTSQKIDSWSFLLTRIAAGLDWRDCINLNTYTVGFSGLLLACALRSRNIQISLWMQDWLEQQYTASCLEEGSFPIVQILQVLRAINRERREGRDVFAIFQSVDDEGGIGKYDSYNSQHISSVLVYGRCRQTDEWFSRHISL